MNTKLAAVPLASALLLWGGAAAQAQLSLSFSSNDVFGRRGDRITIIGTLTNTSGAGLDLLGDQGQVDGGMAGEVSWETTEFFVNSPTTLGAGESYSGNLYLDIASDASIQSYNAFYTVTFQNPTTPNTTSTVTQFAKVTVVPSPEAWSLLAAGMSGVPILVRRRKRQCLTSSSSQR